MRHIKSFIPFKYIFIIATILKSSGKNTIKLFNGNLYFVLQTFMTDIEMFTKHRLIFFFFFFYTSHSLDNLFLKLNFQLKLNNAKFVNNCCNNIEYNVTMVY